MKHARHRLALILCIAALTAPHRLPAQAAGAGTEVGDEIVEMSPFEVNASQDRGYLAGNTTSGSRLDSDLRDTPAPISILTNEFLSDLALNNMDEALQFGLNFEEDHNDASAGFSSDRAKGSEYANRPFRIRGLAASFSVDYGESAGPQDNYNTDRVEISSGPNSVLAGLGGAGGMVALRTKRALLDRSRATAKLQFGSWAQARGELDANVVLLPRILAVRLMGVHAEQDGWRQWDFQDTRRWTAVATFRPRPGATLNVSFERGNLARNISIPANAGDAITRWWAAGSPIGSAANAARGMVAIPGQYRFTYIDNKDAVVNLRGKLQSASVSTGDPSLLPESVAPYDYNHCGPGSRYENNFTNYNFSIGQRFGRNLAVEFAYQHAGARATADNFPSTEVMIYLYGDPNDSLQTVAGDEILDLAGQYYMETNWRRQYTNTDTDTARLSLAWQKDLGRAGWHRFVLMAERARVHRRTGMDIEILVDENNSPIIYPGTPESAANQLYRRHYASAGDYSNYYMGDPGADIGEIIINGKTYHTTGVPANSGNNDDTRDTRTLMLAMQNHWFGRRLVTTLGLRRDDVRTKKSVFGNTHRLSPDDPRVLAGGAVANEYTYADESERRSDAGWTGTFGAVWHLGKRLSFFYNHSSNVGSPHLGLTTLPGVIPEMTDGRSDDAGVMFDFLGNKKYFLRATVFDTWQLRDPAINPLAEDNYFQIGTTRILDGLLDAGLITLAEHDARTVNFRSFTIDTYSKGVEVEFTANPTPSLTLRLAYSYSDRNRDHYFREREPYYSDFRAFVNARDNGAVILSSNRTIAREIAWIDSRIAGVENGQEQPFSSRPHKFNATAKYTFRAGALRGLYAGGAYLFSSKNYIKKPPAHVDIDEGSAIQTTNFFLGYAKRRGKGKIRMSVQLNLQNAFNTSRVGVGRYNDDYTALRRVYLRPPRSVRLTTTLAF
jgi:outer membrane receptor protein involved in Fe transport